jgi:acyl carrier protein
LAIIEAVRPHRWLDITFGLTDGWWKFEDSEFRSHPLISSDRWLSLLRDAGFDDVAHVLTPAAEPGPLGAQALLLARVPQTVVTQPEPEPGHWLILSDQAGVGSALAERVRAGGGLSTIAYRPETRDDLDLEPEIERIVRDAVTSGGPVRQAVFLWGLDAPLASATTPEVLQASAYAGCAAAMHLTRALYRSGTTPAPSTVEGPAIWMATQGAQYVGDGPSGASFRPAAAPLWGFGRVIALEHPDLWGGVVDLDPASAVSAAGQLWDEISAPDGEDQIALRASGRYVARISPLGSGLPAVPAVLRSDRSYVITGGLGSIGLRVARWLAEHGARHLVLLGRRGLPAADDGEASRVADMLKAIEQLGATVRIVAGDVADPRAMEPVFAAFGTEQPPLAGVIHAAAALSSASIDDLTPRDLGEMLRSKATGAWTLHHLDFFVLFSSTTGLLGSKNLAHYAAANVFLDSLAHHRRSLGLPAATVDWGVWEHMRHASSTDRRLVEHVGLQAMTGSRALKALGAILQSDRTQTIVADVNWPVLTAIYEAKRRRPLFDRLRGVEPAAVPSARAVEANVAEQVLAAKPRDRRDMLTAHVRAEAARVLGLNAARLDVRQGLFDLGLDSLMSVDLKSRLERSLGRKLPTTLTFNYPTVEAMADFLFRELGLDDRSETPEMPLETTSAADGGAGDEAFEKLSEDELASLLAEKLAGIGAFGKDRTGR